jgi:hypothetical protein
MVAITGESVPDGRMAVKLVLLVDGRTMNPDALIGPTAAGTRSTQTNDSSYSRARGSYTVGARVA